MRPRRSNRAAGDDHWLRLTAVVGVSAFFVGGYVVVVVGGGVLVGHTGSPSVGLSVIATAVVALGFERAWRWAQRAASQLLGRSPTSPYDVLSRFSETVGGGYPTEDLPARMVRLLAEGTSAEWAQVWLTVQGRLQLAASWPPGAVTPDDVPQPAGGVRDLTGTARRAVTV